MGDIVNKNHDNKVCKANCDANGKAFNHAPYQCTYFSGSQHYNTLLELQEYTDSDILEAAMSLKTNRTNIASFQFLLKRFEGLKADVTDGVRTKEDLDKYDMDDMEQKLVNL